MKSNNLRLLLTKPNPAGWRNGLKGDEIRHFFLGFRLEGVERLEAGRRVGGEGLEDWRG